MQAFCAFTLHFTYLIPSRMRVVVLLVDLGVRSRGRGVGWMPTGYELPSGISHTFLLSLLISHILEYYVKTKHPTRLISHSVHGEITRFSTANPLPLAFEA